MRLTNNPAIQRQLNALDYKAARNGLKGAFIARDPFLYSSDAGARGRRGEKSHVLPRKNNIER